MVAAAVSETKLKTRERPGGIGFNCLAAWKWKKEKKKEEKEKEKRNIDTICPAGILLSVSETDLLPSS